MEISGSSKEIKATLIKDSKQLADLTNSVHLYIWQAKNYH